MTTSNLKTRVKALENRQGVNNKVFGLCNRMGDENDDKVRTSNGEWMTRREFERRYPGGTLIIFHWD